MDKYGYIGIETLLNFCENSKDHSVTPNDLMRMKRVRMPERKNGKWIDNHRIKFDGTFYWYRECSECGYERNDCDSEKDTDFCPGCGADMREGD